jgi:hypothetical protein
LVIVHFAIINGTREVFTLVLIAFAASVMMALGHMFELNNGSDDDDRSASGMQTTPPVFGKAWCTCVMLIAPPQHSVRHFMSVTLAVSMGAVGVAIVILSW